MSTLIRRARVIDTSHNIDVVEDVLVSPEEIIIAPTTVRPRSMVINGKGKVFVPGLIDLHVHFREPGFTHKEDIASGISACLAGGVTSALVMPNTQPAIDSAARVAFQKAQAKKSGFDLMVAGSATHSLSGKKSTNIPELKSAGAKAITDDGKPILSTDLMASILQQCQKSDLICMQHAEDLAISKGASINEGAVSKSLGLSGQPKSAEYSLVERDLRLCEKIDARYHVLHASTKETIDLVARAKRRRIRVSCEVSPHHLLLTDREACSLDTLKKMNPPLRSRCDVDALIEGIDHGVVDAVASDHAPHSRKEKSLPFEEAPFGVVGAESSILVLLSLVKRGRLSLTRAISLMTSGPARILAEEQRLGTFFGDQALKNAVLLDCEHSFVFSEKNLFGRSKNSAFLGMQMYGRVMATFLNGKMAYLAR